MPKLGITELLIVGGIVVLLFGAGRLPKLARSMREARQEFEKGKEEEAAPAPDPAPNPAPETKPSES